MREPSVRLVSIGEFSRLSRLSPKALRLYDDLGLLMPDHVDAATGYRWYPGTQLEQARVVALLRRIGVPLAQVRNMLRWIQCRPPGRSGTTGPGPRGARRPAGTGRLPR